jgi:hypothetical protein
MSAEAQGLQIPIGFSLDEARAALAALEGEARRSGRAIQTGVETGEKSMKSAGSTLMSFAREQRREAATARFFVSEVAQIIPISAGAKGALTQLGGAVVGGGPWALAIAGASVLVGYLVKTLQDEADAAREAARATVTAAAEMRREIAAADASTRSFYESFRSFAQSDEDKFISGATAGLRSRLEKLDLDIEIKQAEVAAMTAAGSDEDEIATARQALDVMSKLHVVLNDRLDTERTIAREAFPLMDAERKRAEAAEKAAEKIEQARQREIDAANRLFEADYNLREQREQAAIEQANRIFEIDFEMGEAREAYEIEQANRIFEIDFELEQRRAEMRKQSMDAALADFASFAASLGQTLIIQPFLDAMQDAATTNRRFSAEYAALSRERRAQALLEQGVVETYGEAQAMVAEESEAAEAQRTAAQKEALAQRLAAQAIEWALQAAVMAVPYTPQFNPVGAAVYAAAAAAAGIGAASLHSQAVGLTQGRGYTAEENDQLAGLRNGGAYGGSGAREVGGVGGSANTATRETIIVIGDPFETPAETARRAARRLSEARRLDMLSRADA